MNKRKIFTISASIGFALILIYLCAHTREADICTISQALDTIGHLCPIASFNTVSILYLFLSVIPLCFALNCGVLGIVCYALWKIGKKQLNTSSISGKMSDLSKIFIKNLRMSKKSCTFALAKVLDTNTVAYRRETVRTSASVRYINKAYS